MCPTIEYTSFSYQNYTGIFLLKVLVTSKVT
jgi:hypothetical protein